MSVAAKCKYMYIDHQVYENANMGDWILQFATQKKQMTLVYTDTWKGHRLAMDEAREYVQEIHGSDVDHTILVDVEASQKKTKQVLIFTTEECPNCLAAGMHVVSIRRLLEEQSVDAYMYEAQKKDKHLQRILEIIIALCMLVSLFMLFVAEKVGFAYGLPCVFAAFGVVVLTVCYGHHQGVLPFSLISDFFVELISQ